MVCSKKTVLLASMLLSSSVVAHLQAKDSYSSEKQCSSIVGTYALTWSIPFGEGNSQKFYSNITFNEDGTVGGGNTVETGQALKFLDPNGKFSVLATPQTGIWRKTDCGYEVSWIHAVSTNTVPSEPAYWAKFSGVFKLKKSGKKIEAAINLNLFALSDDTFCKPAVGPVAITITGSKLLFKPDCK